MKDNMNCPLCNSQLAQCQGSQLSPTDGVTVWCPSHECPAQEVFGHGKDAAAAFEVVKEKYKKTT